MEFTGYRLDLSKIKLVFVTSMIQFVFILATISTDLLVMSGIKQEEKVLGVSIKKLLRILQYQMSFYTNGCQSMLLMQRSIFCLGQSLAF